MPYPGRRNPRSGAGHLNRAPRNGDLLQIFWGANQPKTQLGLDTDQKTKRRRELRELSRSEAVSSCIWGSLIRAANPQDLTRTTKIWTAAADPAVVGGNTAFRATRCLRKRRGAALPTAVPELSLRLHCTRFIRGFCCMAADRSRRSGTGARGQLIPCLLLVVRAPELHLALLAAGRESFAVRRQRE